MKSIKYIFILCIIIKVIIVSPIKMKKSIFEKEEQYTNDESDVLIKQVRIVGPNGTIDFGNDLVLQNKYLTSRIEKLEDDFKILSGKFENFVKRKTNEITNINKAGKKITVEPKIVPEIEKTKETIISVPIVNPKKENEHINFISKKNTLKSKKKSKKNEGNFKHEHKAKVHVSANESHHGYQNNFGSPISV
jgi:hypothetical protein